MIGRDGQAQEPQRSAAPRPLRVSMRPVSHDLERAPYIALLIESTQNADVTIAKFSARSVAATPPDIMHVHWPEHVLGTGVSNRIRAVVTLASIAYARRRGSALVYTAHNLTGHESRDRRFDRWFLASFDRMVDHVVLMTDAGADVLRQERSELAESPMHHVRHGELRSPLDGLLTKSEARAQLGIDPDRPLVVHAGRIRHYKGVPDLLRASRGLDADIWIVGECGEPDLSAEINRLVSENDRVTFVEEFVTLEQMSTMLAAADVVAMPYRNVFNSGSLLQALSIGRKVLVPSTPTFREVADEVGAGWVHLFEMGSLQTEDLQRALDAPEPTSGPDFDLYQWSDVGAQTRAIYRQISP